MSTMKIFALLLLACAAGAQATLLAKAKMFRTSDNAPVGWVTFTKVDQATTVKVEMTNLPTTPGELAVHIHQYGDQRRPDSDIGGTTTIQGSHFDWTPATGVHAWPGELADDAHHIGDMGNWTNSGGAISQTKVFTHLELEGVNSIIGRSVVVHVGADIGNAGDSAGSAGSRIVDGVIGIAQNDANTAASESTGPLVAQLWGTLNCPGCWGWVRASHAAGDTTFVAKIYNPNNSSKTAMGFHIHQFGDLSAEDGTSAGGHFNPSDKPHGLPNEEGDRHQGDLGNAQNYATDGANWVQITVNNISPFAGIVGRAIVVHAANDKGRSAGCTSSSGAAGLRMLHGVLGVQNGGEGIRSGTTGSPPAGLTIDNEFTAEACPMPSTTASPASLATLSTITTLIGLLVLASL